MTTYYYYVGTISNINTRVAALDAQLVIDLELGATYVSTIDRRNNSLTANLALQLFFGFFVFRC